MLYQINPNGSIGFQGPLLVMNWLRFIKIKGRKIRGKVIFNMKNIRAALVKEKVPHVADFLEQQKIKKIIVAESDCQKKN